jgi:MinD superfamily P-loop ATPase
MVCVNKFDLNPSLDEEIRGFCIRSEVAVAVGIPFDESVSTSISRGVPVVEFNQGPASRAIASLCEMVKAELARQ